MDLSRSFLDSLRGQGDAPADELVAAVHPSDLPAVGRLMRQLVEATDPLPKGLPDALTDFLRETSEWPSWGDRELVRQGERVFAKYGPELVVGLFCAALPQCYANHRGVPVLVLTGRMQGTAIDRRIMETAQFLCDIVDLGGLDPDGRGIRTIQKIRLMHAAIRTLVLSASGDKAYDVARRGVPVCQEDLAFTLMSFSVVLLDSVEATGIRITAPDREAWVHLWRVVGHFIGLRDDANPASYAEAQAFSEVYRARNFGPSPEGRELMKALSGYMKRLIPGTLLDSVPAGLIRCMNGHALADMVGVEKAHTTTRLIAAEIRLIKLIDQLLPGGLGIAPFIGTWFDELVGAIAKGSLDGKRAAFRMPKSLRNKRGGVRRGKNRSART
jgi:hypothetical protein